jgi:catecholate siderophore receptor
MRDCMGRTFKRRHFAQMLAGVVLAPGVSLAQSPPAQDATLPEVKVRDTAAADYNAATTSIGGVLTPLRDIPQSITVVNSALMQAQGVTSLADALRNVPGITIGAAEGGSIGNSFNLRGFSARTDLYYDAMRDRGQYYRDVFSLDAVEVLKGPSSMLFGRGSTGGVINQVSKVPSLESFGTATLTIGTQPSVRGTADVNRRIGDASALRIAAMAQKVDSTRDVMDYEDYGVAPSIAFGLGSSTEVILSALLTHNDDMPDYGLPPVNGRPADVDRPKFYGNTDDRTIQDVVQFNARITHRFNDKLKLVNQTMYARYKIDARESGPNNVGTVTNGVYAMFPAANTSNTTPLPLTSLFVGLGSHDRTIDDDSLYNQTDLIYEFRTGPVTHTLLAGLELGRDTNRVDNSSRNIPGNPNNFFRAVSLTDPAYLEGADLPSSASNSVRADATTVAPYLNDTMRFSKEWLAVAGVRYDRYNASLTNSLNQPPSASQGIGFTSVRAGVIFQPTDVQSYYASYGTSFNPSLEQLTLTNGQQSLDPEKSKSYEVGAKWDALDGNLSLTLALFDIEKTNARSQVSPGVYALTGDVRVRGVELGAAGRLTRNWQIFGGYTFLDAEIVSASALDATQGKVPANTPRNSATLWTTYAFSPQWSAGTGVSYMSERCANNNNAVKVDDYFRWDAMVSYNLPKWTFQVNVLNLANRLNYDALIPSDRGRAVPGIDRTALFTAMYRF